MLTYFVNHKGPLLTEFRECRVIVNAVCEDIGQESPERITGGVILLHYNAHTHVANIIKGIKSAYEVSSFRL